MICGWKILAILKISIGKPNATHREEYTYDSGCLSCHTNLQEATMATNKAFIAHRDYFLGTIDDQCTTCHEHVGHADLSDYIAGRK